MIIYIFYIWPFFGVGGATLWCWWCLSGGACRIFPADHPGGHAQSSSVRRAVSLVNRSCRARLMDMIVLIINYLGAPFGIAFIG